MPIWKKDISIEVLTQSHADTAVATLGIEFLEVGDDFIRGRVPVDERTRQPYGILHGGVSVVLAETLGSCGAHYSAPEGQRAVGLDINANHLRAALDGWVTGVARPVHRGRSTQVWQIDMTNDAGELTCVSRITMAILAARPGSSRPPEPAGDDNNEKNDDHEPSLPSHRLARGARPSRAPWSRPTSACPGRRPRPWACST